MPEQSGDYTITFTYDNNSTLLPGGMKILNYEYSLIKDADVITEDTVWSTSLKMIKDTHYKIALAYNIDGNSPSGRKFDGEINIIKNNKKTAYEFS